MEAGDEEKEVGKYRQAVFVISKISAMNQSIFPHSVHQDISYGSMICSNNKVIPFPSLGTHKCQSSNDRPEHPHQHFFPVVAVTGFNGKHHCYRAHDEHKSHESN